MGSVGIISVQTILSVVIYFSTERFLSVGIFWYKIFSAVGIFQEKVLYSVNTNYSISSDISVLFSQ
jgi:hypothetical protein